MSSKSSIMLTDDNEHWYEDCNEPLDERKNAITLEFDKKNIRIDANDEYDLIITITNSKSEIYKAIEKLKGLL